MYLNIQKQQLEVLIFFSYCMRVLLPKICHPNYSNKVLIDFFYDGIAINTFTNYKQG